MTGARIEVTLDDAACVAAVARFGGALRTGIVRAIGTALVEVVQERFDTSTDPSGQKWVGLLPAYAMIKKGSRILVASGMLQRSITFETSGSQITVGTNRIYAAPHQFGATIKAKTDKGLFFVLGFAGPKGNTLYSPVQVQSVKIPARPYLGWGPADQRAVLETIGGFVQREFGS